MTIKTTLEKIHLAEKLANCDRLECQLLAKKLNDEVHLELSAFGDVSAEAAAIRAHKNYEP